jgi:hypothetical protein
MAWLFPTWGAPPSVRACVTTRDGGVSRGPYASLNLATHVQDIADDVAANRTRLAHALNLPGPPRWLTQVHGTRCVDAATIGAPVDADAAWTDRPGVVCAILTADCLPILLCDRAGTRIAAAHAGWRGLCDGVIASTLAALAVPGAELCAWIGPGIGVAAYAVGAELRERFMAADAEAEACFIRRDDSWYADLAGLARQQLTRAGVRDIADCGLCTYGDTRFYSHRRDGVTGRFASLIWIS